MPTVILTVPRASAGQIVVLRLIVRRQDPFSTKSNGQFVHLIVSCIIAILGNSFHYAKKFVIDVLQTSGESTNPERNPVQSTFAFISKWLRL